MAAGASGSPPRGRGHWELGLLLLAMLATAVWVHRIEWVPPEVHRTLVQSDTYRYFHPAADFIHDEVNAGRLPLWNPYQFVGQPFLALPVSGALYPINLLVMGLFEAETALGVHAVLHFFLAALFTSLLAARLGLGMPGRMVAALAYMLSGPMVLGLYVPVHFSTQAWLPAILWALHGLLCEVRLKWALALAFFASLTFYGGYPQLFLYIAQFSLIFTLVFFLLLTPRRARARLLGLLLFSGIIALGWMMPLLLPQLEFTQEASRSLDGLTLQQAARPAIPPGTLFDGISRGPMDAARGDPAGPVLGRVALPILFLPLALCGLLVRRTRAYWLFFMLLAVGLGLLMLGPRTPVFTAYYALPLTALFRGPIRLAFLYTFCGALLMGIGVEGIMGYLRDKRGSAGWIAALGIFFVLLIAGDSYLRTRLISAHPASSGNTRGAPAELIEFLHARPGRERVYFETRHLYSPDFLLKAGTMNQFFVAGDYEPSLSRAYLDYFEYSGSEPWHGNSTILARGRPHAAYIDPQLLDLMSVRFYAALEPGRVDRLPELRQMFGAPLARLGPIKIYERKAALPRAYTVGRIQIAGDQEAAIEALRRPGFAPRRSAVVSTGIGTLPPSLLENSAEAQPSRQAEKFRESRIVEFSPQELVLEASCRTPCLSVLTDLDYPGWRAEVDGRPAPIVRVNGMFRGVALPPGEHQIHYRFAPSSFLLGLWLALGASALAALSLFVNRPRPFS